MPTIMHPLDADDYIKNRDIARGTFLEGECYAFAIALHQGLGWPLVGLIKKDVIWHAGVENPVGFIYDGRGMLTRKEFTEYFGGSPSEMRPIEIEELYAQRPIQPRAINLARAIAEALWPELPWRESLASKALAFADALEKLCREHQMWIVAPSPTQRPCLFTGHGDEGGYEVRPTTNAKAFTIDRYLR